MDTREAVEIDKSKVYIFPESACVACLTESAEIVLVRQYRAAHDKSTVEIPGGVVEKGEEPALAAVREFSEETGLSFNDPRHLFTLDSDLSTSEHRTHVYSALLAPTLSGKMDGCFTTSLETAVEMIKDGSITHAPTVAAILALHRGAIGIPHEHAG